MKNIKRLFAVTLLLAILLSSVSCRMFIRDAEAALEAVEEEMDALKSYEATVEGSFVYYVSDKKVESTITGKNIEVGANTDQFYLYQRLDTKTKCKALSIDQSLSTVEAYYQGNYFISNKEDDGHAQKLYSPATVDQVLEHLKRKGGVDDFTLLTSGTEKNYQKNDDRTKTLTIKGYDQEALKKLLGLDDATLEALNADRLDLEMTMKIDRSFRLSQLTMNLLLINEDPEKTSEDKQAKFTMTYTFTKYDEAEMVTEGLNVEDYKQVDNVFQPERLKKTVEDYLAAAEGRFTWKSEQKVMVMGQTSNNRETDEVTFGIRDGGYFYEVDASTASTSLKLTYANGKQTVINAGKETEKDQTEAQAKSFINNLIKGALSDSKNVTNVVKRENDSYAIYYNELPTSLYDAVYASMGGRCKTAKQTVTVVYSETGSLVSIKSVIETTGSIISGNSIFQMTVNMEYEVTIH